MIRNAVAVLCLLSALLPADLASAQDVLDLPLEFERVRSTPLDESVILGTVDHVAHNGDRFIVTDGTSHAVYIFRQDGSLVDRLSTAKCNPGPEFWPLSARINDERIVVLMSGMPMMQFRLDGRCLGRVNDKLGTSMSWDLSPGGRIAMANSTNDHVTVFEKDGSVLVNVHTFSPSLPQFARRWHGGGLVWVSDDSFVVVGAIPDSLVVVSGVTTGILDREAIAINSPLLKRYSGPDIGNTPNFRDIEQIAKNASLSSDLFLIGDGEVMLTFSHPSTRGFLVMNLEGEVVSSGNYKQAIRYAGNGSLFVVVQPEQDDNGEYPNSMLVEYRIARE